MGTKAVLTKDEYFRELSDTPKISWPAIGLFVLGYGMFFSSTIAALDGRLPMWVACLINGFSLYVLFSPMHESLHGTVSTSHFVNEMVGRVALAFQIPAAPLEVARWVHLKHHANTTSENDPDNFMHHGAWWILPLRWANFDVFYLIKFFKDDTTATR